MKKIDRLFIIDLLLITKQWHKSKMDDNLKKKRKNKNKKRVKARGNVGE